MPYDSVLTPYTQTYRETRDSGVSQAENLIKKIDSQCPNTRFHFYGYSEGADIASHLVNSIAEGWPHQQRPTRILSHAR
ncbi:cutinase family protein [Corynebacterium kroppenstedtii]